MFGSIAGYATTRTSGAQFKHIVYVGQDGHLHDLVAPLNQAPPDQIGIWRYNLDITAAINSTMNAAMNLPAPSALGNVGVYVQAGMPPQIFYYGDDPNLGQQVHVAFPVAAGYFYQGQPPEPPDVDNDDIPGFDGFDTGADGLDSPYTQLPSPAGWADFAVTQPPSFPARPLAIYGMPAVPLDTITVVFLNNDLDLCAGQGNTNGWGTAIDITQLAGSPTTGGTPPRSTGKMTPPSTCSASTTAGC